MATFRQLKDRCSQIVRDGDGTPRDYNCPRLLFSQGAVYHVSLTRVDDAFRCATASSCNSRTISCQWRVVSSDMGNGDSPLLTFAG